MSAKRWLTIQNRGEAAEMVISGPIGKSWWDDSGTSSKEFRDELKKIPNGKKINVRINSEGGSIKDGLEIYNALNERRSDVTCYVDGYAISIASIVALAGSKTVSPKSSIWMIHEPWSLTQGNAEDHKRSADMLDKHGDMLASIYASETGKDKTAMREAMKAESWFTGEEAQAFGLADEVPEDDQAALAALDTTIFRNIPEKLKGVFASLSAPRQGAASDNQTKKDTMKRETIIAVLNKHGIKSEAEATDEQLLALLDTIPANKKDTDQLSETQRLQNQITLEKRARIRAAVETKGKDRIANEDIDFWTDLAMNDEAKIMAKIDKMEAKSPGGEPVGQIIELSKENPLETLRATHVTAKARAAAMRDDWTGLYADACKRDQRGGKLPLNTNTYSATLVTSFLMDGAITNLQNQWAALAAFTKDYSPDPYKPLATGVLKQVTVGSTTQTDATNFETGNNTVAPISVTMHQYSQSFSVSNTDLNNGLRMENLVTINVANFANTVIEAATAPITTANFTGTPLTQPPGAFGWSDMATLWGQLKKSPIKNAILDGEYLANLINTPTFFQQTGTGPGSYSMFGWDVIALNTDWTGAGTNVRGFACNPQAIIGIMGLPLDPPNIPGGVFTMNTFVVPGLNISVAIHTWFSLASRTMWTSYDVMAGFAKGDATAGYVIKSA